VATKKVINLTNNLGQGAKPKEHNHHLDQPNCNIPTASSNSAIDTEKTDQKSDIFVSDTDSRGIVGGPEALANVVKHPNTDTHSVHNIATSEAQSANDKVDVESTSSSCASHTSRSQSSKSRGKKNKRQKAEACSKAKSNGNSTMTAGLEKTESSNEENAVVADSSLMDQPCAESDASPPRIRESSSSPEKKNESKQLVDYVVKCLTDYGICVVDFFMGEEKGTEIHQEVMSLQEKGALCDGQLIGKADPPRKIRGDQIVWVDRGDTDCSAITLLIQRLDNLVMKCNRLITLHNLNGRTKVSNHSVREVYCWLGNFCHLPCTGRLLLYFYESVS